MCEVSLKCPQRFSCKIGRDQRLARRPRKSYDGVFYSLSKCRVFHPEIADQQISLNKGHFLKTWLHLSHRNFTSFLEKGRFPSYCCVVFPVLCPQLGFLSVPFSIGVPIQSFPCSGPSSRSLRKKLTFTKSLLCTRQAPQQFSLNYHNHPL